VNILVLGGTRFAGIHLVNELVAEGHDVTIATRGKTSDSFGNKVTRIIIERENADSLNAAFEGKFFDVAVDNIAYASNDIRILLDSLNVEKYVMTSTCSVYSNNFHENMEESEFNAQTYPLKWCNRDDFPYDEVKRQAEAALFQEYITQPAVAVRFPYIFGKDDYTKRLFFYVEHVFSSHSMNIDNLDARISFIDSTEAGRFLAHVATKPVFGCISASGGGTISIQEIISYVEKCTSKKAVIEKMGAMAPLNGTPSFSLDTCMAEKMGFKFMNINEWVYPLIDFWIDELSKKV